MTTASFSIYQNAMGAEFAKLAPEIQRFHTTQGTHVFEGIYTLRRGRGLWAGCVAQALRLPGSDETGPTRSLRLDMVATPYGERWTRRFARFTTRSVRLAGDGVVRERIGPVTLVYGLSVKQRALRLQLRRLNVLGIPWPGFLLPNVWIVERGQDGKVWFDTGAGWGRKGLIAACSGSLNLSPPKPAVATDESDATDQPVVSVGDPASPPGEGLLPEGLAAA